VHCRYERDLSGGTSFGLRAAWVDRQDADRSSGLSPRRAHRSSLPLEHPRRAGCCEGARSRPLSVTHLTRPCGFCASSATPSRILQQVQSNRRCPGCKPGSARSRGRPGPARRRTAGRVRSMARGAGRAALRAGLSTARRLPIPRAGCGRREVGEGGAQWNHRSEPAAMGVHPATCGATCSAKTSSCRAGFRTGHSRIRRAPARA
jgi:hypothetical protein